MTKRVVLYARVSTRDQAEHGTGLQYQLYETRQFAEEQGWEVVAEVTAPARKRYWLDSPELDELRRLAANGAMDTVFAWRWDRYGENPIPEMLALELEEYGVELRAIDALNNTPDDEMLRGIKSTLAKAERRRIAARSKAGRRQKAREGKAVGSGPTAYGYRHEGDHLVVEPAQMAVVRRIFEMIAGGTSINGVRKALEADGILAPRGGKWWKRGVIREMVLDDKYRPHTRDELEVFVRAGQLERAVLDSLPDSLYGVLWYGKQERIKNRVTITPPSEWIAVPVPDSGAPREIVDAARAAIRDNVHPRSKDRRFWELYGIAYCECGAKLVTHSARRNGSHSFYYVCSRRRNDNRPCEYARYHPAEKTELRVRDGIQSILRRPDVVEERIRYYASQERQRLRNPDIQITRWRHILAEVEEKRERYLEQHAAGLIRSLDALKEKIEALERQREEAEREIATLRDADEYLEELDELAGGFVRDLPYMLEEGIGKHPPKDQGRIYRGVYDDLKLRVTAKKSGELVLEGVFGLLRSDSDFAPTVTPRTTSTPPDTR